MSSIENVGLDGNSFCICYAMIGKQVIYSEEYNSSVHGSYLAAQQHASEAIDNYMRSHL